MRCEEGFKINQVSRHVSALPTFTCVQFCNHHYSITETSWKVNRMWSKKKREMRSLISLIHSWRKNLLLHPVGLLLCERTSTSEMFLTRNCSQTVQTPPEITPRQVWHLEGMRACQKLKIKQTGRIRRSQTLKEGQAKRGDHKPIVFTFALAIKACEALALCHPGCPHWQ